MAHISSLASLHEPLVPLAAKQLQAAVESQAYATTHELFLTLKTEDHLQYHHSVAAVEQQRISAVERSLADDHLPQLILPTVQVDELWTLPRRVADALEAACRWLNEDELKAYEEAVISEGGQPARVRRYAALKIEAPLLCTDPDADCDELQMICAVAREGVVDVARRHGIHHNTDDESALFTIPKDAVNYAAQLEENVRTEKMIISEEAIRSLVLLMGSMEWTEKDQNNFWDEQLRAPTLSKRYLSPPLPPVESSEYFVPDGDVCLVSDASEVSSGISEALAEAEQFLNEFLPDKGEDDTRKDSAGDLDTEPIAGEISFFFFEDIMPHIPATPMRLNHQESDISVSPSTLSASIPLAVPSNTTADERLFNDWIEESIFESNDLPILQTHDCRQCSGDLPNENGQGDLVMSESSQNDLSDDSGLGEGFHCITERNLFSLEENVNVSEIKIAVPSVGIKTSLPDWYALSEDLLALFQSIVHGHVIQAWLPSVAEGEREKLFEAEINSLTEEVTDFADHLDVDIPNPQHTKWRPAEEPDFQSILCGSEKPMPLLQRSRMASEELPDIPLHKPEQHPRQPEPPLKVPNIPASEEKLRLKDTSSPWDDLVSRFKKRKSQVASHPQIQNDTAASSSIIQKPVQLETPELVLGFRAFMGPTMAIGKSSSQDANQVGKKHATAEDIAVAGTATHNNLAVQPIECIVTHLPKIIISTAIPRSIRGVLLQLLPCLEFVERDYRQQASFNSDCQNDEADIAISPSTGIIVASMVGLRQTDAQRRFVFQARVASVAQKYEKLYIFIFRINARPAGKGEMVDFFPELSPSDAMAFAQLQGFVRNLECKTSAFYVGGDDHAVAHWVATLIVEESERDDKRKTTEAYLVEEETREERLLRQVGFNVYDAQIVMGVSQDLSDRNGHRIQEKRSWVERLLEMPVIERISLLGPQIGCPAVLARVNRVLSEPVDSQQLLR
ncbi:hypothetical protein SEPCBS57363_006294 [Sporothrix epigloea]|uniref:Uncharacterized protein n=1 Tax=Sporothrix epigloea TaxID=1892477 RepID=A0ABP0E2A8_9PEZI